MCHARGRLLEHPRIPLDEEYVEQQVKGQWSEVDECGDETPILFYVSISTLDVSKQSIPHIPGFCETPHGSCRTAGTA